MKFPENYNQITGKYECDPDDEFLIGKLREEEKMLGHSDPRKMQREEELKKQVKEAFEKKLEEYKSSQSNIVNQKFAHPDAVAPTEAVCSSDADAQEQERAGGRTVGGLHEELLKRQAFDQEQKLRDYSRLIGEKREQERILKEEILPRISKKWPEPTGAVRSSDADHLDFVSIPMIGLLAVARTAAEGASKYGRWNYAQGLPAIGCLSHAMRHIAMFILGDRGEPHLEHAAWNCMAAIQGLTLDPEANAKDFMGPGFTLSKAVLEELEKNALSLMKRREVEGKALGEWKITDLPEIQTILSQRIKAV